MKSNMIKDLFYKFFLMKSRTKKIIKEFQLDQSILYSWGMKRSGEFLRNNTKNKNIVTKA